jgi:hypothetical protein
MTIYILFESTYTRFKSSKTSFIVKYRRAEFLFNRVEICLYVSSSSLVLTYVIVIRSIEYQFSFVSSLLCIANNQCSNFALFSINIAKSKMINNRFVFSNRFVALMSAIISTTCFVADNLNNDVIDFCTLRVRS